MSDYAVSRSWALALGLSVALAAGGCRNVLGIEDRAVLEPAEGGAEDAGADVAPLPPTYCETLVPAAQFCADFDRAPLLRGWEAADQVPYPGLQGGTLDQLFADEGGQLVARLPSSVAQGTKRQANVLLTLPVSPSELQVAAHFKLITEEIPAGSTIGILSVAFGDAGGITVYRETGASTALAILPNGKGARIPSWPVGAARKIEVGISRGVGGGAGFAWIVIDGTFSPDLPIPAEVLRATPVRLIVGLAGEAPFGPAELVVDDVAVYWHR